MTEFNKKVDFIVAIEVQNANPNGDPLAGNSPRKDIQGFGLISDVAIKRKIRNRLQDEEQNIFVQSRERTTDGFKSLEARYNAKFKGTKASDEELAKEMCAEWIDVRSFGQVVTFEKKSIGIRGPVSVAIAKSLSPISDTDMQITRSTNGMEAKDGKERSSDTMGTKRFVNYGVYLVKGSINVHFAQKTGFTQEDAELIKESLKTLFVNDMSSARPEGSMAIKDLFWFTHPSPNGAMSSAKVFESLKYNKLNTLDIDSYDMYEIHLDSDKKNEMEAAGVTIEHFHDI